MLLSQILPSSEGNLCNAVLTVKLGIFNPEIRETFDLEKLCWLIGSSQIINFLFQFTKTILGQGHLSPFTLNVLPTYWCYDYALSLYPIPDVLVIGDQFKSFSQNFHSCDVINPVNITSFNQTP